MPRRSTAAGCSLTLHGLSKGLCGRAPISPAGLSLSVSLSISLFSSLSLAYRSPISLGCTTSRRGSTHTGSRMTFSMSQAATPQSQPTGWPRSLIASGLGKTALRCTGVSLISGCASILPGAVTSTATRLTSDAAAWRHCGRRVGHPWVQGR